MIEVNPLTYYTLLFFAGAGLGFFINTFIKQLTEWWTLYQRLTKLVQIRVQSVTKRLKNNITGQNTANDTTKNELLVKNYGKN